MKIVIGITTLLLLAVFSVAYLYFSNLTVVSRSNDKTLAAIPSGTSVIFTFSNDRSFYEIFKADTIFDAITGDENKRELTWLQGLLIDNQDLYHSTQGQKIFLSFHQVRSDSLEFLWVMPLLEDLDLAELEEVIEKSNADQIRITNSSSVPLLEIRNNTMNSPFYIGLDGGIARGSFSERLVLKSLDKSGRKISKEFIKDVNQALIRNNDALASLFINHDPGLLNAFFQEPPNGNFRVFNSSEAYSNLHINYKSDALMFNGIARLSDYQPGYFALFLQQQPVRNTIKKILPLNLSTAICFGLSDYEAFNSGLRNLFTFRKELEGLEEQVQLITTETGINPDRDIKKLWGNEFCNVQLSTFEELAIISITNGRQLEFFIEPLSMYYSGDLRKMIYPDFFYYYFGDPMQKYTKPYFAITDNLVIISNSAVTLQRFLNEYHGDRLINSTEAFARFDQLVADQSNISFLLHFKNSQKLFDKLLKRSYSGVFKSKVHGFDDFYGLSYQLTSNADHFFTNFYLGLENKAALSVDSPINRGNNNP